MFVPRQSRGTGKRRQAAALHKEPSPIVRKDVFVKAVRRRYEQKAASRRKRRGSVLIIVLAILSILLLLAATLSYTARLEELSARNFADGVQARMAAQTGVATFFAAIDGQTTGGLPFGAGGGIVAPTSAPMAAMGRPGPYPFGASPGPAASRPAGINPSPIGPGSTGSPPASAGDQAFSPSAVQSSLATDLAEMRIGDESAKINLNALGSWAELGGFDAQSDLGTGTVDLNSIFGASRPPSTAGVIPFGVPPSDGATSASPGPRVGLAEALYAVLSSDDVNYKGASRATARTLARAIVRYRYGPDGRPGQAGFDDDGDSLNSGASNLLLDGAQDAQRSTLSNGFRIPHSAFRNPQDDLPRPGNRPPGGSLPGGSLPAGHMSGFYPTPGNDADGLDNDYDGVIDEPGEGIDEPDEFIADPRRMPYGDDRPFRTVEDLMNVEGMTVEMFQVLRPYVTVFSASERRIGPDRDAPPQMDLNRAQSVEMYERLRLYYAAVSPETLTQFSANIADYRDADSVPTLVTLEGAQDPIFGVEIAPFITEVWPDSTTDDADGDDGQYIEIHNPYDVPLSLAGWSLRFRQGPQIGLNGTLAAGGFLIVTDDYNELRDPTPEDDFAHYGSFYDIFGLVPNNTNRLMVEIPELEIPNQGGMIELVDAAGNLIDLFAYGANAVGGLQRSYQRGDPRVRAVVVARCTPYAPYLAPTDDGSEPAAGSRLLSSADIKNAPIESALELFNIGCSHISAQGSVAVAWRMPTIGNVEPDGLDEQIVDLFTVWVDRPPVPVVDRARVGDPVTTGALYAADAWLYGLDGVSSLTDCGRINVNSAPLPVLRSIPGLTFRQAEYLLFLRETAFRRDRSGRPLAYATWSELLADDLFWDDASPEVRLEQVAEWIDSISFASNAYLIESENLKEPPSGPRLASRSRVQALVSTDGRQNQVVFWRYLK